MSFNFRTMTLCLVVASFFVSIKSMTHNWPHYKTNVGSEICTCAHMEAVIEYFKDKNDLTMVLGAGDVEDNYTRFKDHTFVVTEGYYSSSNEVATDTIFAKNIIEGLHEKTIPLEESSKQALLILSHKLTEEPHKPILIPLNFNSDYFKNFLDIFSNKFKDIIFDIFVGYYAKNWDINKIIEKIFNALKKDGEFYSDHYFQAAFSPLDDDNFVRLEDASFITKDGNTWKIQKETVNIKLVDGTTKNVEQIFAYSTNGTSKNIADLKMTPKTLCIKQGNETVREANRDEIIDFILDSLKAVGFIAEYKQKANYPLLKPWPKAEAIDFSNYNYIYARKPAACPWNNKWHAKNQLCTCAHMEAVIEYFKDKNDLTMVLGAGNMKHDYTNTEKKGIKYRARFPNYTFVVNDSIPEPLQEKFFLSVQDLKDKLKNGQTEPIPIPLNFTHEIFFYFLDRLTGKFKEIIFDDAVIKFVYKWGLWQVNKIFDALKDGGEFYLDTGFARISYAEANSSDGRFSFSTETDPQNFISISNNQVEYKPEYGNIADYNLYVDYLMLRLMRDPKFDDSYALGKRRATAQRIKAGNIIRVLKNNTLSEYDKMERVKTYLLNESTFYIRPKMFTLKLLNGKNFTTGRYVTKKESDNQSDGTFLIPNDEFMIEHIVAFLKLVGFEAEYRQKAPYPSPPNSAPWVPYPDPKQPERTYTHYDYIYARKPIDLNKRLISLKESLTKLKNKLGSMQEKLEELKLALGRHK